MFRGTERLMLLLLDYGIKASKTFLPTLVLGSIVPFSFLIRVMTTASSFKKVNILVVSRNDVSFCKNSG